MNTLLTDWNDVVDFLLAGKPVVTFKSKKTGNHFTYKIRNSKDKKVKFVSLLFGDNETNYRYIGCVFPLENGKGSEFRSTSKSQVSPDSPGFQAFRWAWDKIFRVGLPEDLEVYHEGYCGRCGKRLTEPESIKRGLGPHCYKIVNGIA